MRAITLHSGFGFATCAFAILTTVVPGWAADALTEHRAEQTIRIILEAYETASPQMPHRSLEALESYQWLAKQYPEAARRQLQRLREEMNRLDKDDAAIFAGSFLKILEVSPPDTALELLDEIYKKFAGDAYAYVRSSAYHSLMPLSQDAKALAMFKRWLTSETNTGVVSDGFGAFSLLAQEWDAELMKALQGKIAQAELDVGKRIVELNALTEPEKIYGAVKDWFNEFVDYMETTEPISPTVTMERVQENIRICLSRRLLRLPLSLLKDRRSEIESFHQRCERLRAAASAQFDSARTDADRMRWANQEGLAGSISRVLRQILDRIELNP